MSVTLDQECYHCYQGYFTRLSVLIVLSRLVALSVLLAVHVLLEKCSVFPAQNPSWANGCVCDIRLHLLPVSLIFLLSLLLILLLAVLKIVAAVKSAV